MGCWKERIEKEDAAFVASIKSAKTASVKSADTKAPSAAPAPESSGADDDIRSVRSSRSYASSQHSEISSNVTSSSYAARKVELLSLQLEEERKKRKDLEAQLKKAGITLP